MTERTPVVRSPAEMVEPFREFGTATISSDLREECGILKSFMVASGTCPRPAKWGCRCLCGARLP